MFYNMFLLFIDPKFGVYQLCSIILCVIKYLLLRDTDLGSGWIKA